ncbi:MAG: FISUMP domain-containing protein [Sphingobacteriales bacterium]
MKNFLKSDGRAYGLTLSKQMFAMFLYATRTIIRLTSIGVAVLLVIGCKKDHVYSTTWPTNRATVNFIVVSRDTLKHSLLEVDSSRLIFNANGPGVEKIAVGILLFSDPSQLAPGGFSRQVTDITTANGKTICSTVTGVVSDAVPNGKLHIIKTYSGSDIFPDSSTNNNLGFTRAMKNRTSIAGTVTNTQSLQFSQVYYDADGNPKTTDDQVTVKGGIGLSITLNFDLEIKNGVVQTLGVGVTTNRSISLNAESKLSSLNFNKDYVIGTYNLPPIEGDIGIPPFAVPIVLVPKLVLSIGVDGQITAKVTTGVTNTETTSESISYANGQWGSAQGEKNSFDFQPPALAVAGKFEPYLQAKYEILPYGIPNNSIYSSNIYIAGKAFINAEAKVTSTGINSSLNWGISFGAQAQMSIFGHDLLGFKQDPFYTNQFLIAEKTFALPQAATPVGGPAGVPTTPAGGPAGVPTIPVVSTPTAPVTPVTTLPSTTPATSTANQGWTCGQSYTDPRDGQVYPTTNIGGGCWIAKNLNYTNSNTVGIDYQNNVDPSFGKLYSFSDVVNGNLAPAGWHIPTSAEIEALNQFVNSNGGALKSTSKWASPNIGATNTTGFSAVPSGMFANGVFYDKPYIFYMWSSSVQGNGGTAVVIYNNRTDFYIGPFNGNYYFAVRVVKNN